MTGQFAMELAQSGVLLQTSPLSNLGNQILRYIVGGINDVITGGFGLILAGIVYFAGTQIADRVADSVSGSKTVQALPSPEIATEIAKGTVLFASVIIAVSVAGISAGLLGTVLLVTVLPVGLAIAIAVGIALGYGTRDHVKEHVDDWMS